MRKFWAPLWVSHTLSFALLPPWCTQPEFPSRSFILRLYPKIPKNTESNFSVIHSPCWQRRNPLSTCYPSVHLGLWPTLFNRKEECRDHLQAPHEFRVFLFNSPTLSPRQSPSSLWRILPCSHFNLARHELLSILVPITTWCDDSGALDYKVLITSVKQDLKNVFSSLFHPEETQI